MTDTADEPGEPTVAADDAIARTVATYDRVADEYADRHADRSVVAEVVASFLDRVDGDRILDVGCGPGWESETFAGRGKRVVAVDLTPAFCRRTADRVPEVAVARADMRDLPLQSDVVDGVWALASFLHVPRAEAAGTLVEFARVLRPGGTLSLTVKRGQGTRGSDVYEGDDRQFTYYDPDDLRTLVGSHFTVTELTVDGDWIQVFATAG